MGIVVTVLERARTGVRRPLPLLAAALVAGCSTTALPPGAGDLAAEERRAFFDCAMIAGEQLWPAPDAADLVAAAALATCSDEEIVLANAYAAAGLDEDAADMLLERVRKVATAQLVALIVRLRAREATEEPST